MFGRDKSRIALAVASNVKINIEGDYEDDRVKAGNVANALGTVFSGNAISSMRILDEVDDLQARVDALEAMVAGMLTHTHNYQDDNGTDTITKTTTEIN